MWTYQGIKEVIANGHIDVRIRYLEHLLSQGGGIDVSFFEGSTNRCIRNCVGGHLSRKEVDERGVEGQNWTDGTQQRRLFLSQ